MPSIETAWRYQKAVLWEKTGVNDYGEDVVSSTPVEISVRWENKQSDMLDPVGATVRVDAQVVVAQEVAVGSRMWEGSLSEWLGTGSVGVESDVCIVVAIDRVPDIKARKIRRTLGLKLSGDDVPTE